MAKFPTTEARQELGVTPTTAVRFRGDTRTGEGLVGAAIGQVIMSLGSRWYLMEADAQLDEAKVQVEQEHIRLMLELPGLEPSEHAKAYEESIKTRQGFIPKNRMAASAYSRLLEGLSPRWGLDVNNATKAKLKDNVRAVGFVMQQGAIRTGDFQKYLTHLAKGKMQGVYSAEDVVKYRQSTIDGRERYVKLQTAQQLEQLEIQREGNRDEISDLIRAGKDPTDIIENSSLIETEQDRYHDRYRVETERRIKGEEIVTDRRELRRLDSLAYDVGKGAITESEFKRELDNARYPSKGNPLISDDNFTSLANLAERKFESYQSEAMDTRESFALTQLVTHPSELGFEEKLAQLTSQFEKDQARVLRQLQFDNLDQYKKALRDWLRKNKDANADEIYIEGRRLLTHYHKTPDQLRKGAEPVEEIIPMTQEQKEKFGRGIQEALIKGFTGQLKAKKLRFSFSLDALNRAYKNLSPEKKPRFEAAWKKAKRAGATQEEFLAEWNK